MAHPSFKLLDAAELTSLQHKTLFRILTHGILYYNYSSTIPIDKLKHICGDRIKIIEEYHNTTVFKVVK